MEPEMEEQRQAGLLLSKANLLRVRGQKAEAIDACAEALRLVPLSGDASALLAEIYEEQGQLDEALQWYSMAVDNAPENPSYREHLKRLAEKKQAAMEKAALAAPKEKTLELPSTARRPDPLARVVWLLCAIVAVFLALMALVLLTGRGRSEGAGRLSRAEATPAGPPSASLSTPAPVLSPAASPVASPAAAPPTSSPASENGVVLRLSGGVAYLNLASGLALREAVPTNPTDREALVRQALHLAAEVSHVDARVKAIQITLKEPRNPTPALIAEIGAYDAIRLAENAPLSDLTLVFKTLRWPDSPTNSGP